MNCDQLLEAYLKTSGLSVKRETKNSTQGPLFGSSNGTSLNEPIVVESERDDAKATSHSKRTSAVSSESATRDKKAGFKSRQVTGSMSRGDNRQSSAASTKDCIRTTGSQQRQVKFASDSRQLNIARSTAEEQGSLANGRKTILRQKHLNFTSGSLRVSSRRDQGSSSIGNKSAEVDTEKPLSSDCQKPATGHETGGAKNHLVTKESLDQTEGPCSVLDLEVEERIMKKVILTSNHQKGKSLDEAPRLKTTTGCVNPPNDSQHSQQYSFPAGNSVLSLLGFRPDLSSERVCRTRAAQSSASFTGSRTTSPLLPENSAQCSAARIRPYCRKTHKPPFSVTRLERIRANQLSTSTQSNELSSACSSSSSSSSSGSTSEVVPSPRDFLLASLLATPSNHTQQRGNGIPSPATTSSIVSTPPSEAALATCEDGPMLDSSFKLNLSPCSSEVSSATFSVDLSDYECTFSDRSSAVEINLVDEEEEEEELDLQYDSSSDSALDLHFHQPSSSKPQSEPGDYSMINGCNGIVHKAIKSPEFSNRHFLSARKRVSFPISPLALSPLKIPNGSCTSQLQDTTAANGKDRSRKSKISRRLQRHTLASSESRALANAFKSNGLTKNNILTKDVVNSRRHTFNGLSNSSLSTQGHHQQRQTFIDLTQDDSDSEAWSQSRLRKRCRSVSPQDFRTAVSSQQRDRPSAAKVNLNFMSGSRGNGSAATAKMDQPNTSDVSRAFDGCTFGETVRAYRSEIMEWQFELNQERDDKEQIIYVQNVVDMAPLPRNFKYITSNIYTKGVPNPQNRDEDGSLCGCQCYVLGKRCDPRAEHCCPSMAGAVFGYTKTGKVRVVPGTPLYECNSKCSCPMDCWNRVIQRGRTMPLTIFRTENRGWGVKAVERIQKGTFITEYVGEVITSEEAESRGKKYDLEGMTYLFDLDFDDENTAFTIDSAYVGNISHFFNHSVSTHVRMIVYNSV